MVNGLPDLENAKGGGKGIFLERYPSGSIEITTYEQALLTIIKKAEAMV